MKTDPSKIAEAFNKHFSTVGRKLAQAFGKNKAFSTAPRTNAIFTIKTVSVDFVKQQLQKLKVRQRVLIRSVQGF